MTPYAKGANFERKVLAYLRNEMEAVYAMRTAGSHSLVDIVAFWFDKPPWMIQCALHAKKTKEELQILAQLAREAHCVPVLASQGKGEIKFDIIDLL